MTPVIRENFDVELLAAFPELRGDLEELHSWYADAPASTVVDYVFTPHLLRMLEQRASEEIDRACAFMERMATSPDDYISETALQMSTLERLLDSREWLETTREHMGPATLALSLDIQKYWEDNFGLDTSRD